MKPDKGKGKDEGQSSTFPAYTLNKYKVLSSSYVDKRSLEKEGIGIYQAEFAMDDGLKVKANVFPREILNLQTQHGTLNEFSKAGVAGYFTREVVEIDVRRAWELQSTIQDDGSATLTDKEGHTVRVNITEQTVREALNLKPGKQELKHRASTRD